MKHNSPETISTMSRLLERMSIEEEIIDSINEAANKGKEMYLKQNRAE